MNSALLVRVLNDGEFANVRVLGAHAESGASLRGNACEALRSRKVEDGDAVEGNAALLFAFRLVSVGIGQFTFQIALSGSLTGRIKDLVEICRTGGRLIVR